MSWLNELVLQHAELESPISFWYWASLSALSAVLKDNVWLNRADVYKLYPNIYVMLHADSGLKKGPPVNMAFKLVKAVNNTYVVAGRSSIQGILKSMGTSETEPGGRIKDKSKVFICSSEFSSSIVEDKVATTILTDLYDRNYRVGNWQSLLKMEQFEIREPTVTMLTATNEAHSEDFFMRKDVQGGYFARTFIIHESKRNRINSLMFPLKNPPQYEKAIEYLKVIAQLRGAFTIDEPTARYYDEWYHAFVQATDELEIKDDTGTLNRFGDSVLKVAMLLSLAEAPELVLRKSAMEEAIKHCERFVGAVRRTTIGRGKSANAQEIALVLSELVRREPHMITRAQLNKKFWSAATAEQWDDVTRQLEAAGSIRIEHHGNAIVYVMNEAEVDKWKAHFAGRNK